MILLHKEGAGLSQRHEEAREQVDKVDRSEEYTVVVDSRRSHFEEVVTKVKTVGVDTRFGTVVTSGAVSDKIFCFKSPKSQINAVSIRWCHEGVKIYLRSYKRTCIPISDTGRSVLV